MLQARTQHGPPSMPAPSLIPNPPYRAVHLIPGQCLTDARGFVAGRACNTPCSCACSVPACSPPSVLALCSGCILAWYSTSSATQLPTPAENACGAHIRPFDCYDSLSCDVWSAPTLKRLRNC